MLYITPHTPLPHSDTRQIPVLFFAPRLRYAFTFSPYRYGSFPLTIPHSIKSAALPVTNGVAKDVPVNAAYPPPTVVVITSTPGATRSGFTIFVSLVNPLPEKSAYANVLASYAPTDIARAGRRWNCERRSICWKQESCSTVQYIVAWKPHFILSCHNLPGT